MTDAEKLQAILNLSLVVLSRKAIPVTKEKAINLLMQLEARPPAP